MSGELARHLEREEGIPYNTASQRVARFKKMKRIKGFFVSNQSLCFLEGQDKDELYDALSTSLYKHGRKYWYCLNALKIHGGVVSQKYLECYTNYPVLALKGHIPFNKVMQRFVSEGIVLFQGDDYLFSPKNQAFSATPIFHRTVESIKDNIIENFQSMMKNMGMISFNTGEAFGEYGKYRWAFKGVSKITGLVSNSQKQGFLLADILFGVNIRREDVLFFIEKIKSIQSFNNAPKIIPFLIVDNLEKEALIELKKHGIAVGFIKELFGEKYAEALQELVVILNNAGASLKANPDKYLDLIAELKKYNETLIYNIRGTLFEYFVSHIHLKKDCKNVDLGREIFENNSRHEMDVFATYGDKIVIAECKATKNPIEGGVINNWVRIKIPAFKKWLDKQETLRDKSVEFEYWSIASYTDEAIEILRSFAESNKKFKVSYFGGDEIRSKTVAMKNKKMKEALDNYFLKLDV